MNLPAISLFEVPSLHTARFFSAGLEGRSKKFRPEAFARILAAILEFFGGCSDDRFEGWFGPGVVSVLLLFKIATVTKDFKLKIDFVFSFHLTHEPTMGSCLTLLSDFCLDFYCSLLSSGVVNIIYK